MNSKYLAWFARQSDDVRREIMDRGAHAICSAVFAAGRAARQGEDAAISLGYSHRDDDMGAIIAQAIITEA